MTNAAISRPQTRPAIAVKVTHSPEQSGIPAQNPAEADRMERALRAQPGFALAGRANLEKHTGAIIRLQGGYLVSSSDGELGGRKTDMSTKKVFQFYLPFDQMDRPRHVEHRREAQANVPAAEIDRFEDDVRATAPMTLEETPNPYLHAELRLRLGRGWILWTDTANIGGVETGADGTYYVPDEAPNTAHRNFEINTESPAP